MRKKVKGTALFYALMVSLIVGIICSSLILFRFGIDTESMITETQVRLISNLQSATALVTATGEHCPQGWQDLFDGNQDSVFIKSTQWGAFNCSYFNARDNGFTEERTVFFGSDVPKQDRISLYVADRSDAIAICGNTKIKGTVYIPEAGTKRAYIEGKNFTGDKMVDGKIITSDRNIPPLSTSYLSFAERVSEIDGKKDSVAFFDPGIDSYSQSFSQRTLRLIIVQDSLRVDGISFEGNVIVQSSGALVIGPWVKCEHVLFVAPRIYIEQGFQGRGQWFVSESFQSDSLVVFDYPSFIGNYYVAEKKKVTLTLGESNELYGGICVNTSRNKDGLIRIGKKSVVTGIVYSGDLLENQGTIEGTTYCSRFFLKTSSAVYTNHLLDAKFDVSALHPDFLFPVLFEKNILDEIAAY